MADKTHWLLRPGTIRRLWQWGLALLAILLLIELTYEGHPHFAIDSLWAFNGVFGFVACAVFILCAKIYAVLFQRRDTYYADAEATNALGSDDKGASA